MVTAMTAGSLMPRRSPPHRRIAMSLPAVAWEGASPRRSWRRSRLHGLRLERQQRAVPRCKSSRRPIWRTRSPNCWRNHRWNSRSRPPARRRAVRDGSSTPWPTCSSPRTRNNRRLWRRPRLPACVTCWHGQEARRRGCRAVLPGSVRVGWRCTRSWRRSWSTSWWSRRGIHVRSWSWMQTWRRIWESTASVRRNCSVRSARSTVWRRTRACPSTRSRRCDICSTTWCRVWAARRARGHPNQPRHRTATTRTAT